MNPEDDRTNCAKGTQRQRKLTEDTQRKRTVFTFSEIKLAKNTTVPADKCRRRTTKKDKRKIKKPRKQNRGEVKNH